MGDYSGIHTEAVTDHMYVFSQECAWNLVFIILLVYVGKEYTMKVYADNDYCEGNMSRGNIAGVVFGTHRMDSVFYEIILR